MESTIHSYGWDVFFSWFADGEFFNAVFLVSCKPLVGFLPRLLGFVFIGDFVAGWHSEFCPELCGCVGAFYSERKKALIFLAFKWLKKFAGQIFYCLLFESFFLFTKKKINTYSNLSIYNKHDSYPRVIPRSEVSSPHLAASTSPNCSFCLPTEQYLFDTRYLN